VSNNADKDSMWALADSQNILTKFGLEKIPVKNIGQFSDFEDLED
jgi:hypothetical protein